MNNDMIAKTRLNSPVMIDDTVTPKNLPMTVSYTHLPSPRD